MSRLVWMPAAPELRTGQELFVQQYSADGRPEPWRPPLLAIYLSREELPDLKPGRREASSSASASRRRQSKAPAPKVGSGAGGSVSAPLPDVRLSPPLRPQTLASAHAPKVSPPVPPAPGSTGPPSNGKLRKPDGERSSLARLFSKSRA